jgi:hypothetical protein
MWQIAGVHALFSSDKNIFSVYSVHLAMICGSDGIH